MGLKRRLQRARVRSTLSQMGGDVKMTVESLLLLIGQKEAIIFDLQQEVRRLGEELKKFQPIVIEEVPKE